MKSTLLPASLLLAATLCLGACSSSSSDTNQDVETPSASAPDTASTTATVPANNTAPSPVSPAISKKQAIVDQFPELKLPYTITLTGDTFDKAEGKKAIKPALDEMRDYLGFEFTEDGYQNSFIGLTPVGKITSADGTLLLYVSVWDGSCPTLSTSFIPNNGGPRTLDLEPTSCGPCAIVTGPITFTKDTLTKKLTKVNDCAEEENPSKSVSETVYALKNDGLTLTKETPWQKTE